MKSNLFFPESTLSQLKVLMGSPIQIALFTHFNPDGDALGSTLAMKIYLEGLGHKVAAVLPSASPSYYEWMPDFSDLIVYSDKEKTRLEEILDKYDLMFCLDFNHTSRVQVFSSLLAESKIPKVLIDHHEQPSDEFQYVLSYPGTSSTCELVYHFINQMSSEDSITMPIATCLYTGLITDTGGFQFSSTHASTHMMAASLIEKGIDPSILFNNCFNNFSLNRLQLFGYVIDNNMKIYSDKKLAILFIDRKTKEKFDIQDGDTEGLVNYPLKVSDIQVSILFKQDYDKIRISFRSKGDLDVNQIARTYFSGGGHKNAAGGMSKLKLSETISYLESIMDQAF